MTPDATVQQTLAQLSREHNLDHIEVMRAEPVVGQDCVLITCWTIRRSGVFAHGQTFDAALHGLPPLQTEAELLDQRITALETRLAAAREERARLG